MISTRTVRERLVGGIIVMLVCTMLVISVCTEQVHAANVCKEVAGSSRSAVTFTVKTDKGWLNNQYITLKGTKGIISYTSYTGRNKEISKFGMFNVVITNKNTGKREERTWKDGSCKIKLQKNCTYLITVSPWNKASIQA